MIRPSGTTRPACVYSGCRSLGSSHPRTASAMCFVLAELNVSDSRKRRRHQRGLCEGATCPPSSSTRNNRLFKESCGRCKACQDRNQSKADRPGNSDARFVLLTNGVHISTPPGFAHVTERRLIKNKASARCFAVVAKKEIGFTAWV